MSGQIGIHHRRQSAGGQAAIAGAGVPWSIRCRRGADQECHTPYVWWNADLDSCQRSERAHRDMVARNYSDKTLKTIFAASGNRCAFPGCDRRLVVLEDDVTDQIVLGEVAHIVGLKKGSARWRASLSDEDRNAPKNLVVLCGDHHKIIDSPSNDRKYSEVVVRRMKHEHERIHSDRPSEVAAKRMVQETLTSSMLLVEGLPARLYSARCRETNPLSVVRLIQRAELSADDLVPFYLRDGVIWSFWDLSDKAGPLAASVDTSTASDVDAEVAWRDPDLHRRYVAILNRSVTLHLERRGLFRDKKHGRHYFAARRAGEERRLVYPTLRGKQQPFSVVREERSRAGDRKGVWWHQAVRLRFERIGPQSWYVTLRPEFHLSADGVEPLPARRVTGRVTRRKSTMYNDPYLQRVHFWRWFLTNGEPRLIIRAGQPIVVSASPVEVDVSWPGVPEDDASYVAPDFEETLLTLADRADAIGNMSDWEELLA